MTRYASMSRGAREAKNELKVGLFGSDKPVLSIMPGPATVSCLGVMSVPEMRDPKSAKRFP